MRRAVPTVMRTPKRIRRCHGELLRLLALDADSAVSGPTAAVSHRSESFGGCTRRG
jgi:hypothetical protein